MNSIKLALKMLRRDIRSGELTLLIVALLIAVSSSTAILLFADRLQRTMQHQAAEFLAADLAISGPMANDATWQLKAGELGLKQAQTLEFPCVLIENQAMQLAAVKAVSDNYPLRGHLKTSTADFDQETLSPHGPESGQAWVESRILPALGLKLGEQLTVGEKALTVSKVLNYEPDKSGNFYSFSPRVMINEADLPATGIIQPGSRVHYVFQLSGQEAAINAFKDWVKPQLLASQRLLDIHTDRPEIGSALSRAEQYLGLCSIVVVLISGIAIAMTSRRYSERHFNTIALLLCLGCKRAEIFRLFACQFLLLGAAACGLGCLLGWVTQEGLFYLLRALLPQTLTSPGWVAVFFGFISGMGILFGFALPPLLRLQRVSPLRVLRRDLEPVSVSGWLVYGCALGAIGLLIWRQTGDLQFSALIMSIGCLTLLVLGVMVYLVLKLARKLFKGMSLSWRFGLQGLLRNSRASVVQILVFSITLTAMALSFVIRTDLLDNWQQQLPEQAPNYFALNIMPEQQSALQTDLEQAQIYSSKFYPVVRGRLIQINTTPVQERVAKDSQGQEATQRELSLTTSEKLPEDNKIIAGEAWQTGKPGQVSVEQKLAENLKIGLGDRLTFLVGAQEFTASVVSFRQVKWDTMRPNFFMIFSPGTLDAYPSTYLTSFYLPARQKNELNSLLKKYPAMTVLEVEQILQQFKTLLAQLTQAINLLVAFALLAGFAVLFATVTATLDQRILEGALMRVLGIRIGFLRTAQLIEFSLLGGLSGLLAAISSESILYTLYTRLMQMNYQPSPYLWIVLPVAGAIVLSLAGYWGVRKVVKQSPLPILRNL